MEKFQIVKYGLMQVVAIVYGVMACGAGVRANRSIVESGVEMPSFYYVAHFFRDYGFILLGLVILWVRVVAYFSSPLASRQLDGDDLACSGLVLAILFAVGGSYLAVRTIAFAFVGPA